MKKLLLLCISTLGFTTLLQAQTGISAAGTAPDASAMLDVIATDKGFLAPRVALLANNNSTLPVPSPTAGLLVYNTATAGSAPNNVTPGYYYWDGTISLWQKISAGNTLGFIQNQNAADQAANWRITGSGQWGGATSKGSLSIDQGSSLELGGTGSPYIDIANATGDDFDARIQLTGNDFLNIEGANLGIGSASPAHKLDVVGNGRFNNGGATYVYVGSGGGAYYGDAANTVVHTPTGGSFYMANVGTDGTKVAQSDGTLRVGGPSQTAANLFVYGNAGIGTTSAGTRLDVVGTAAVDYLRVDPQDVTSEGGEMQLIGAGVNGTVQIDNFAGNVRIHTLAAGKVFNILGGSGIQVNALGGSGNRLIQTDNNGLFTVSSFDPSTIHTGSGTANYLARWTTATNLGIGVTYDNGTNVGIGNTAPASLLHIMGKTNIHQSGAGGGQNRFEGLDGVTSANGRAQLVLSSAYSDLVIASSQGNDNHGSTLTFASYNPSNSADYRKFVINQGNWGARFGYLDFGFADAGGRSNPHSNINGTDNVMTMDGINKRVGIGTMSPQAKLHVYNAYPFVGGTDGMLKIKSVAGNCCGTEAISLQTSIDDRADDYTISGYGGDIRHTLALQPQGGYVGIGTVNPTAKLHISAGDASYALFGPNASWNSYLYVGAGTNTISAGRAQVISTNGNLHLDAGSGQNIYIANYNGSNTFMQTGGGSVGIGNTSPGYKLHVSGDIYANGGWLRVSGAQGLYFESYGSGIHGIQADGGDYGSVSTYGGINTWEGYSIDGRFVWMAQDNGNQVGLYNDVDNNWLMLINRVATNDGYIFYNSYDYHYNMRIQHTNGHNYASYDGDNNWDFYSDRRLKEHIEKEENILDRLLKLDVVNYDFIEHELTEAQKEKGIVFEKRKYKEIGFIAQDVEQYFPSIVSETDDPNYDFKVKALGYSSFGILAVGAIKELKIEKDKEIAELKAEIEILKSLNTTSSENAQLKSEIAELKKMMLEIEKKVNTK